MLLAREMNLQCPIVVSCMELPKLRHKAAKVVRKHNGCEQGALSTPREKNTQAKPTGVTKQVLFTPQRCRPSPSFQGGQAGMGCSTGCA